MAIFTVFTRHTEQPAVHDQNDKSILEPKTESEAVTETVQEGDVASIYPEADDVPSMPTTPSLSQLAASGLLDAKDRRAYEVARQRRKKPADRRKARTQSTGHSCSNCHPRPVARPAMVALRERLGNVVIVDESDDEDILREKPFVRKASRTRNQEVLLEDLIQTAKVHRDKGQHPIASHVAEISLISIVAGDFELIPKMRPVLVLDDFESNDIFELDETWEHIYSSSTSSDEEVNTVSKPPSYAQVVSTNN